jgi:hypothetical protein
MSKATKAIGYCRTAVSEQGIGESIETQRRHINEYAKRQNLEIVEWFDQIGYVPITFPYSKLDDALEYCKEDPDIKEILAASSGHVAFAVDVFFFWKTAFERIGVTLVTIDDPDRSLYLPMPSDLEDLMIEASKLDSQKRSGLIRKYMAKEGTLKMDDQEIEHQLNPKSRVN